jgi:hypothetical protein
VPGSPITGQIPDHANGLRFAISGRQPPRHPASSPPPANFRNSPQTQPPQPLPAHPDPKTRNPGPVSAPPAATINQNPHPGLRVPPARHPPRLVPLGMCQRRAAPPRSARRPVRDQASQSPEGASPRKAPVVRPGKPQPRASETVEHGPVWPRDFSSVDPAPPSPGQIPRGRTASSAALSQPTLPDNGPPSRSLRSPREPTLCYRIYRQVQHETVTPCNPKNHSHRALPPGAVTATRKFPKIPANPTSVTTSRPSASR